MIQIQIQSISSSSQTRVPSLVTLKNRKPFFKIRSLHHQNDLIVFDRYRFQQIKLVSQSLRNERSKSVGNLGDELKVLSKLRSSNQIQHCTFSDSQQMLVILTKDKIASFNYISLTLKQSTIPKFLLSKVKLPLFAAKGKKRTDLQMYEYLNLKQHDFDLYKLATKELKATCWLLAHSQHGQFIFGGESSQQIVKAGLLAQSFVVNLTQKLNLASSIRVTRQVKKTLTLMIEQTAFQIENQMQVDKGLPIEVRTERAYFDVVVPDDLERRSIASTIQMEEVEDLPALSHKYSLATCPITFKSVLVLNLKRNFECFLIDVFGKQNVVNIKTKLSRELMLQTLEASITDVCWTTIEQQSVFTITFSDGAVAILNSNGDHIQLTAQSIFNQNVLANQAKFWARQDIQKMPVNSKFKMLSFNVNPAWILTPQKLVYFTGLDIQLLPFQLSQSLKIPVQVDATYLLKDLLMPVVTNSNKVILDDDLFNQSDKVFIQYLYSCKLTDTVFKQLKDGFNTVLLYLRQSKFVMAVSTLLQIKEVMARQPELYSEVYPRLKYEQAVQTSVAQVMKEGQMFQYDNKEYVQATNDQYFVDKTKLLRPLVDLLLFKLIQTLNSSKKVLESKALSQDALLPDQMSTYNLLSGELYCVFRRVITNFYSSKQDLGNIVKEQKLQKKTLRDNFLQVLFKVAQFNHWNNRTSKGRLSDLHHEVKVILPKPSVRPGLQILSTLLNQVAQIKSDQSLLTSAVNSFKLNSLDMSGAEYIAIALIIRKIQNEVLVITQQSHRGKQCSVWLPGYLKAIEILRKQEILDLNSCVLQKRHFILNQCELQTYGNLLLKVCFDLYFKDDQSIINSVMKDNIQIADFLLYMRFLNELKADTLSAHVFVKLVSLMMKHNYSLQPMLASFNYLLQDLQVFGYESPVLIHTIALLKLQFNNQSKQQYPQLLKHVLKAVNKQSLAEIDLPDIPLDPKLAKLNNYLFDTFSLYLSKLQFVIDINVNALANAPTLFKGLLDAMQFNQLSKVDIDQVKFDELKMQVWQIILFLWLVQCRFVAQQTTDSNQQKCWQLRALGVEQVLLPEAVSSKNYKQFLMNDFNLNNLNESKSSNNEINLSDVYEIYFLSGSKLDINEPSHDYQVKKISVESLGLKNISESKQRRQKQKVLKSHTSTGQHQMFDRIGRALVDFQFQSFLKRLTPILSVYSKKVLLKIGGLRQQIQKRVDSSYWMHYKQFREVFGLKLNYSLIKVDEQSDQIKLVKRIDRKTFKTDDSSLTPMTFIQDITTLVEETQSIPQERSFSPILDISKETEQKPSASVLSFQNEVAEVIQQNIKTIGGDNMSAIYQRETQTQSPAMDREFLFSPNLEELLKGGKELKEVISKQVEQIKPVEAYDQVVFKSIQKEYLEEEIKIEKRERPIATKLKKFSEKAAQVNIIDTSKLKKRKVKKGLKKLQNVIWRKQTHNIFSAWFTLKVKKIQFIVKQTLNNQSEQDDSTSGGLSTIPTTQDRGRGSDRRMTSGGRGQSPSLLTPDSSAFDQISTFRGRTQRSPVNFRGKNIQTGGTQDDYKDEQAFLQKFKSIPVEEDQDIDWSNRGLQPNRIVNRREKILENNYLHNLKKQQNTGRQQITAQLYEDEKIATSRFADSESQRWTEQSDREFVFDRKNRFLDLVEHARRLYSPEVKLAQHLFTTQQVTRSRSFSPTFKSEPSQQSVIPQTITVADPETNFYTKRYQLQIMLLKPNGKGFVNKYVPLLKTDFKTEPQPQPQVRFSRLHKMGTLIRTNKS